MENVILEKLCPGKDKPPITIPSALCDLIDTDRPTKGDLQMTIPLVQKLRLTAESEQAIFGDLDPYRDCPMPPLPWGRDHFYEKKLAVIDEKNTAIYNQRQKQINSDKSICPGVVNVFRAHWDVVLESESNE